MGNQTSRPSNSDSKPADNAHPSNQLSSASSAKDGVVTSNHNTMASHPAITNVAISHPILSFLNTEKSVENYGLAHQGAEDRQHKPPDQNPSTPVKTIPVGSDTANSQLFSVR